MRMHQPRERLDYLLNRHANSEASVAEQEELDAILQSHWNDINPAKRADHVNWNRMFYAITGRSLNVFHIPRSIWWAAASLLLIAVTLASFWPRRAAVPVTASTSVQDIMPGGTKATLSLANGTVIQLDSIGDNTLLPGLQQHNGQLQYEASNNLSYHTLTTPRGGQFRVILPDGTKAWLNAASSLHYPTAFTGSERVVEVTGEVYFEVEKNSKPFRVKIDQQTDILVLGTSFNVNAYTDESGISTTLLEGSVRIGNTILQPGQQAVEAAGTIKIVRNADVARIMAWKNGLFSFSDADLPAVLRQLARWYDVDVVYEGKVPERKFQGKMDRGLTLQQILKILSENGVKSSLSGRTLTISE